MFQAPKLTNAGKTLYYENMAGTQLVFTNIKLGSGTLSGPIATMTNLVKTVVTIPAAVAAFDSYVDVSGVFSNTDLTAGFYWREIGIFAANPNDPDNRAADILYCYQNAYDTADYIPVASVETVEKRITVPLVVGDATHVSCEISKSLIFLTVQELDSHNADGHAHPALISGAEIKQTPVDGDSLALVDSADGSKTKRVLWSAIKDTLKTWFDTKYAGVTHSHAWSAITGKPNGFVPTAHKDNHKTGGTDALAPGDIGAEVAGAAAAVQANLTTHAGDAVKHITAAERTAWNGKAAGSHTHSPSDLTSAVPITKGGTGATTAAAARTALAALAAFAPTNITISATWSGTGPWTQSIAVAGVLAAWDWRLGLHLAKITDDAARKLQEKAFACITWCETYDGGITLTCRDKKPDVAISAVLAGEV